MKTKRFTGKFSIGQIVYLNDPTWSSHGARGTVTEVKPTGKSNPYRVQFPTTHVYWPEHELSAEPVLVPVLSVPLVSSIDSKLPTNRTPSREPWPEITAGFGVGGAGSDDYNMATEAEHFTPQFSRRKSSGQLWEPCARGGCDNEPSCLDCGYCLDKHCHCGEE